MHCQREEHHHLSFTHSPRCAALLVPVHQSSLLNSISASSSSSAKAEHLCQLRTTLITSMTYKSHCPRLQCSRTLPLLSVLLVQWQPVLLTAWEEQEARWAQQEQEALLERLAVKVELQELAAPSEARALHLLLRLRSFQRNWLITGIVSIARAAESRTYLGTCPLVRLDQHHSTSRRRSHLYS